MTAKILNPDLYCLNYAAKLLRSDDLVCIPTESVYGLAGNALSEVALEKIFAVKGRPKTNPLIAHVKSPEDALLLCAKLTGKTKERFAKLSQLWPAPLTLVLPKNETVPSLLTANSDYVAVRVPAHAATLELLSMLDFPLAAPSANLYTQISPTNAKDCLEAIGDKVSLIIDGDSCIGGIESTVVNISDDVVSLLRPGLISKEIIEAILDEPVNFQTESKIHLSPGLSKKHYSPTTKLLTLETFPQEKISTDVGVILFSKKQLLEISQKTPHIKVLSETNDLDEISQKLFSSLRELDQAKLSLILIDSCETSGLGLAIMDRINRALTKE